jgi:hypothetical protein
MATEIFNHLLNHTLEFRILYLDGFWFDGIEPVSSKTSRHQIRYHGPVGALQ